MIFFIVEHLNILLYFIHVRNENVYLCYQRKHSYQYEPVDSDLNRHKQRPIQ
jgi:hypothetical protein